MPDKHPSVTYYRPIHIWTAVAIGLLLLAGVHFAIYILSDNKLLEYREGNQNLQNRVTELSEKLQVSQSELDRLQISIQVDTAALEQARQQMVEMQQQIYRRDQELELYRQMLQDGDQPSGLSVGELKLTAIDDRHFRYYWVARQRSDQAKKLQVNAKLWVTGLQDAQVVSLPLYQLDEKLDAFPIELQFKYFVINEGVLQLPEGFTPQSVRVTLRYSWMKRPQIDQSFDWQIEE